MKQYNGEVSITIQAPIESVYAYLLDFTRHPEWVANVSKVQQLTPGAIDVGTVFECQEGPPPVNLGSKLRMMVHFVRGVVSGAKTFSRAEITALEPNRRIAWKAGIPKGEGYFNLALWEFVLEEQGQATRLKQSFSYQPQESEAASMIASAGVEGLRLACGRNLSRLQTQINTLNAPTRSASRMMPQA